MFDKVNNQDHLLGKTNRIVEGTAITGDISTKADFRLDGILTGNFTSEGKIVIGPTGAVLGDIVCKSIDIEGKFSGKLQAEGLLNVKSKAHITGEVIVGKLAVEPGATFEASCEMRNL
ncbi:MAG: polymer-forming cytoskeletal protein [Flavobacterium sp.]|jgi:cytoskeletal protein CcmA (bactofilin family)|nr:polymer-forming cytoskeletal protein [Flavobacterium sp.]